MNQKFSDFDKALASAPVGLKHVVDNLEVPFPLLKLCAQLHCVVVHSDHKEGLCEIPLRSLPT
jgi:hypothetical protein